MNAYEKGVQDGAYRRAQLPQLEESMQISLLLEDCAEARGYYDYEEYERGWFEGYEG